MFNIGDTVKLLPPFSLVYGGEYVVEDVRVLEDGSTAVRISMGADFDPQFLEKI